MSVKICSVCGMIINESNFDFNSHAFLTQNSKDDFKFCPFCGASAEYLFEANSKENRSLKADCNDEETLTILDHAMKLELFNGDFYRQASTLAEKTEVKKVFEALSRIEFVHARIHQRLGGFRELPELSKMDYEKYKGDDILINQAKIREEHAVAYYKGKLSQVSSEKVRCIFDVLSIVEEDHKNFLMKQ